MLRTGGASERSIEAVESCVVDLDKDDGWTEACNGCTYVMHVASPLPIGVPKDPDDVIRPARDGTLRALKAAKAGGTVKRVVFTSSFGAISK